GRGNLAAGGTATFTVELPAAELAAPADGATIDAAVLNGRQYIDVTLTPTSGDAIDDGTVGDPDPEFVLSGPSVGSAGVQVSGIGVRQSGNTFRYTFTGSFGPGQYTVAFVAGSFGDDGGSVNLAQTQ